MGEFGAMRLGAKYPRVFKAFSGLSTITQFEQLEKFVADFEQLKTDAVDQDCLIDWILKNREILHPFRFDCGRDDILTEENRELHKALETNGIQHEYFEYEGGHSWDYWEKNIEKTLMFFDEICERRTR